MSDVKKGIKDSKELLNKGKRSVLQIIFSRTSFAILALALQVGCILLLFMKFSHYFIHYYATVAVLDVIMGIYIANSDDDQENKIMWLAVILLLPVTGTLLYWFIRVEAGHKALKKRSDKVIKESEGLLSQKECAEKFEKEYPYDAPIGKYLFTTSGYPVYENTETEYLPLGEDFLKRLVGDLKKAQHFIFLEYFIVENGKMWSQVEEVLKEKAASGVQVRLLYDGTCEFARLPEDFPQYMAESGIQCRVFSPIRPIVSTHYNFRDHRKIAVIDGRISYTGGLNLADEYANYINPYGHWKDTAIRLEGEATRSFTLMFLQMWHLKDKAFSGEEYLNVKQDPGKKVPGYVIPYGDAPLDDHYVGEMVYTHILNTARSYVHIMTPYLILGNELMCALKFAALRGVEVSIIMPAVSDHMLAFALAKISYKTLLKSGVKLYEYTPGFVHAKSFVSDDIRGSVGTINLDYRSLRHHFECATYLCGTDSIRDLEDDFQKTLEKCHKVTMKEATHIGLKWRVVGYLMKIFAPLM